MEVSNEPVIQSSQISSKDTPESLVKIADPKLERGWRNFLGRLFRNRTALVGLFLLALVVGSALFAPWIAPYPVDKLGTGPRLQGPSAQHLFGTDALGRDVFSRVIFGSQTALQAGIITIIIATGIGTLIGLFSGFYGGWLETVLMRFMDLLLAFPTIFLALLVLAVLGTGLTNGIIAIGISTVPGFARLVRGTVLSVKAQDYVLAARATGSSNLRILFKTVFPNTVAPIIVLSTLVFPSAVLASAGLSFIGLGAQPPSPDWGAQLVDGQVYLRNAPWLFNFPGLAIFITVMGSNLLGNALRDLLDPQQRGR
jgi:peptide/nickel transport system permease protein